MGVSGIIGILLVISLIVGLAAWAAYAYRNPHSTSGQMLIRVRLIIFNYKKEKQINLFYFYINIFYSLNSIDQVNGAGGEEKLVIRQQRFTCKNHVIEMQSTISIYSTVGPNFLLNILYIKSASSSMESFFCNDACIALLIAIY